MADAPPAYVNLWNKAAGYYGAAGQPAPLYSEAFVPMESSVEKPATAYTTYGPDGRTVYVSPKLNRRLSTTTKSVGVKPKSARGRLIRERRRSAQETLLHEWAHVYQDPSLAYSEGLDKEVAANTFAAKARRQMFGGASTVPRPLAKQQRAKYGPGWLMRGQFGSNYGLDPTTIR